MNDGTFAQTHSHPCSLLGMLKSVGRFSEGQLLMTLRQVVDGLGYLHRQRVIHRDIKPVPSLTLLLPNASPPAHIAPLPPSPSLPQHNILLTSDGVSKLADFGCSSLMDSTKTSTRTAVGTMAYMSPECMGCRASFPSDMWSLGLTAVHIHSTMLWHTVNYCTSQT